MINNIKLYYINTIGGIKNYSRNIIFVCSTNVQYKYKAIKYKYKYTSINVINIRIS